MLETRNINLVIHENREGEPVRVKLTYRPTEQSAEGEGPDFDQAKLDAMEKLERLMKKEGGS